MANGFDEMDEFDDGGGDEFAGLSNAELYRQAYGGGTDAGGAEDEDRGAAGVGGGDEFAGLSNAELYRQAFAGPARREEAGASLPEPERGERGRSVYGRVNPNALPTHDELAAKGERGGVETAMLNRQEETGIESNYDGSWWGGVRDASQAFAHAVFGRPITNAMNANLQALARGTYTDIFGNETPLEQLPDATLDYVMDNTGANGFAGVRALLGERASHAWRGEDNIMRQWDEREGAKFADEAERKRARVAYAKELAQNMISMQEESKLAASDELAAREETFKGALGRGLLEQGGYTARFMIGKYGFIAGVLEGVERAGELLSDKTKVDKNGEIVADAKRDTMGAALAKGAARGVIAPAVELVGGKLLMAGAKGAVRNTLGRIPLVKAAGGKLAATAAGKSVAAFARKMDYVGRMTGMGSFPEEMAEEWEDQVLDAAIGLDRRASENAGTTALGRARESNAQFFTAQNLGDLAKSMILMQVIQGGAAHALDRMNARRVDAVLENVCGVERGKLRNWTANQKQQAFTAWVEGLSEENVRNMVDGGSRALNRFMSEMFGGHGMAPVALKDGEGRTVGRALVRTGRGGATAGEVNEALGEIRRAAGENDFTERDADGNPVERRFTPQTAEDGKGGRKPMWTPAQDEAGNPVLRLVDAENGVTIDSYDFPGDDAPTYRVYDARGRQRAADGIENALAYANGMVADLAQRNAKLRYIRRMAGDVLRNQRVFVGDTMADVRRDYDRQFGAGAFDRAMKSGDGQYIEGEGDGEISGASFWMPETDADGKSTLVPATDRDGNPVYETDAKGKPVLDAAGNPVRKMVRPRAVFFALDSNRSVAELNATAYHEVARHSGLAQMYTPEEKADFLRRLSAGSFGDAKNRMDWDGLVRGQMAFRGKKSEAELWKDPDAVEEIFAVMTEGMTESPSLKQRFMANVYDWYRNRFKQNLDIQPDELAVVVDELNRFARRGGGAAPGGGVTYQAREGRELEGDLANVKAMRAMSRDAANARSALPYTPDAAEGTREKTFGEQKAEEDAADAALAERMEADRAGEEADGDKGGEDARQTRKNAPVSAPTEAGTTTPPRDAARADGRKSGDAAVAAAVAADGENGTQLSNVVRLAVAIETNDEAVKSELAGKHFRLAKTSDTLKGVGLTGDFFTIRSGVVLRHNGKDDSHNITPTEWVDIADALANRKPLLVETRNADSSSFRIWTRATIRGRPAIVGADVKNAGRELTVNSIATTFGAEGIHPKEDGIVYPKSSEEVRSVLTRLNSGRYPASPQSTDSIAQPSAEVKGEEEAYRDWLARTLRKDTPKNRAKYGTDLVAAVADYAKAIGRGRNIKNTGTRLESVLRGMADGKAWRWSVPARGGGRVRVNMEDALARLDKAGKLYGGDGRAVLAPFRSLVEGVYPSVSQGRKDRVADVVRNVLGPLWPAHRQTYKEENRARYAPLAEARSRAAKRTLHGAKEYAEEQGDLRAYADAHPESRIARWLGTTMFVPSEGDNAAIHDWWKQNVGFGKDMDRATARFLAGRNLESGSNDGSDWWREAGEDLSDGNDGADWDRITHFLDALLDERARALEWAGKTRGGERAAGAEGERAPSWYGKAEEDMTEGERNAMEAFARDELDEIEGANYDVTDDPNTLFRRSPSGAEAAERTRREYDEVVARYTNPDGTKRPGWMHAPNGKPTRLTDLQWVQVRTPSFKKWFGDWERGAVADAILGDADIVVENGILDMPQKEQRSAAKALYDELKAGGPVVTQDGRSVKFTGVGFKKAKSHSADPHILAIVPILRNVISTAHYFGEGDAVVENGREMKYHLYARRVNLGDGSMVARIVLREDVNGNIFYDEESTSLESIREIHDPVTREPNTGGKSESPYAPHSLAEFFGGINPDSVSKVVDENGEPRVVWHGSEKRFSEFSNKLIGSHTDANGHDGVGVWGRGHYFSDRKDLAEEYQRGNPDGQTIATFLDIRNPMPKEEVLRIANEAWDYADPDGKNYYREYQRLIDESVRKNDYDGVMAKGKHATEYVAISPTQIKSATDNTGSFDPANPDIRFSVRRVTPEEDAAYMDAVKRGDTEAAEKMERDAVARAMPDTKVVGADGKPMKVYHGSRTGANIKIFRTPSFFSDNRDVADMFKKEADFILRVNGKEVAIDDVTARQIADELTGGDYTPDEMANWGSFAESIRDIDDNGKGYGGRDVIADALGGVGIDTPLDEITEMSFMRVPDIYECYVNITNPLEIDFKGKTWGQEGTKEMEAAVRDAAQNGYDGVIVRNIREGGFLGELRNGQEPPLSTDYIPVSPNQIKLADAVTRDDAGNVIPLSQRFDQQNPDIRFSVRLAPELRETLTLEPSDEATAKASVKAWRAERKAFTNRRNGRTAELKADWTKIFSEPAKKKSANYAAHYAAANRLDTLFENGVRMWDEPPRNGSRDIRAYAKYGCPFEFGGETYLAKITVKEYADGKATDGFYSIEAISVEKIGAGGINAGITSIEGHELDPGATAVLKNMLQQTPRIVPNAAAGRNGGEMRFSIAGARGASALGVRGVADAEAMEKDGRDRTEIWRRTGWWRGADGKWRFELPPVRMKGEEEVMSALRDGGNEATLGKLLDAPKLFAAYPQLKGVKVVFSPEYKDGIDGWYAPALGEIRLFNTGLRSPADQDEYTRKAYDNYLRIVDSDEYLRKILEDFDAIGIEHGTFEEERADARWMIEHMDRRIADRNAATVRGIVNERGEESVYQRIVHEVQHAVQMAEGFEKGGDVADADYWRIAGEVEARNAARRDAMTPEERAATPPWETEDVPADSQIMRFSIRVNPRLREEVEAALAKRSSTDTTTRQMKRHEEIEFSENIPFFGFLGLPNVRVVTDVVKIRKFAQKHHLTKEQIADIPNRYDRPVAVMKDGTDGYVVLTDMMAETDNGEEKPVRLFLRPKEWKSGEVVFVATAMSENAADERNYYEPILKSGLLFADENRIAGLGLEEETESILRTQASGDHVLTASDYSKWSTAHSVAQPGAGAQGPDVRFSIPRLYTGSAADYERPSLHAIGTGEGSQVYGWGLYASNRRGVAESYAKINNGLHTFDGRPIEYISVALSPQEKAIKAFTAANGDKNRARETLVGNAKRARGKSRKEWDAAVEWFDENGGRLATAKPHLYEQTWFTDRAPGDESHLLKWYGKVTASQKKWIKAQAEREGLDVSNIIWDGGKIDGAMLYNYLATPSYLGSPKEASEFLARAGIDGVKYPVGSYGKAVKDGDKAGWNYVSFRDDNIRVDHKWRDGGMVFRRVTDKSEIARLENDPKGYTEAYASAQVIDGKVYSPMAAYIDGKLTEPFGIGEWQKSEEHPELADAIGNFKLDKTGRSKDAITAKYNPYWHSVSLDSPLNDQFSTAYARPNLVMIKVRIPNSDLLSGYRAENAKDPVGALKWKSGDVTNALKRAGKPDRTVFLSRYRQVMKVLSNEEAARLIARQLEGVDIRLPANVVTPAVRDLLVGKYGVRLGEPTGNANARAKYARELREQGVRFRMSSTDIDPITLRNEIDRSLKRNANGHYAAKANDEITFSEHVPHVLYMLGAKNARIYTKNYTIRKIVKDHSLLPEQVAGFVKSLENPVAVLSDDGGSYVVLTDIMARNLDGQMKPVMIWMRPDSKGNYIASAYSRTLAGEKKYVNLINAKRLLYLDKNKVAALNLGGEAKSSFVSPSSGNVVKTPEDLSSFVSVEIIPQTPPSAQGGVALRNRRYTPDPAARLLADALGLSAREAAALAAGAANAPPEFATSPVGFKAERDRNLQ